MSIDCAIYVGCSGPETALPDPVDPSGELADGWRVAIDCAVDNPGRVLADSIVTYEQSTTPYTCTTYCQSKGYKFAGVEYGDECYCGTGFAGGVDPQAANSSDCNMRCAGSWYYTCGGSWRMQIFTSA